MGRLPSSRPSISQYQHGESRVQTRESSALGCFLAMFYYSGQIAPARLNLAVGDSISWQKFAAGRIPCNSKSWAEHLVTCCLALAWLNLAVGETIFWINLIWQNVYSAVLAWRPTQLAFKPVAYAKFEGGGGSMKHSWGHTEVKHGIHAQFLLKLLDFLKLFRLQAQS